jgi:hypothetical protein
VQNRPPVDHDPALLLSSRTPIVIGLLGCLLVGGCSRTQERGPAATRSSGMEAGKYEVYNPTSCTAEVFTSNDPGVGARPKARETLGQVASGARMVFTLPQLPAGTRLYAVATIREDVDCERVQRVRISIRRLGS